MRVAAFGVLLLSALALGCAGVSSAPVVNSPGQATPPSPKPDAAPQAASPSAPPPQVQSKPGEIVDPEPSDADDEAAGDTLAETDTQADADDDDAQPAEEVVPSPLDELPEKAPEVSDAVLEREKNLVAEAFPGFDIPMVLNDQVVGYVNYFTTRHQAFFEGSLVRSGRYVAAFQEIFEQAGLPKDLVYMAHVESAFKTNAYSRARAKGIFQFIAGTGRRYGLRIDGWVDERSDPEKSARAAAAYLKDLYGMFGDWYLALAAYNAGEGKISRSLAQTKKNDFWSLASTRSLRAETRNYVPAILAATLIAKQPEKYGFDVERDAPLACDDVMIEGQTDLRILARIGDIDYETLRQLNPQLRRGVTPPDRFEVRVPAGRGEALSQAYALLPAAERMVLARHQVAKGESVAGLARRYGLSTAALARANGLSKTSTLKEGQQLVVPALAAPVNDREVRRAHAIVYRVQRGDTLGRIAKRYRTTPAAIASASGIGVRSPIRVGQKLIVPASRSAVASRSSRAGTSVAAKSKKGTAPRPAGSNLVHTVRRGETLYRIADRYQVTVNQICALNNITPNGVLYPGTRLTIRSN
ncbi:MAG TPA: LysM peptidoglycan-binding domain-containing protein [Candidatus Polarisedimenticolaceae bacterium]|nr:LysM peptidoglycan-binding domain-containing protein [Candidatus Polarisedimenticolaceae bacterium]